jgi:hypothetical protein
LGEEPKLETVLGNASAACKNIGWNLDRRTVD